MDMTKQPNIYTVRGKKVVLDRDLASAFGVETKLVKRNVKRHPELFISDDFSFEMTEEECLRCLPDTTNHSGRGGSRYLPFAFTEAGVQVLKTLMKSSVNIDFSDEPPLPTIYEESWSEGTVVMYQPENRSVNLEVKVTEENVWLNRSQIAILFDRDIKTISKHINNSLQEELLNVPTVANFATVQIEGGREVTRYIEFYNLDMVLSVGYRVKSSNGISFRRWANKVIKEHLLNNGSIERRVIALEEQTKSIIVNTENRLCAVEQKVDFVVDTKLPPIEMIFYEGENFKAYDFLCTLIESANKRIVLIDNYIDRKTLIMLNKRKEGVSATVYTHYKRIQEQQFLLDIDEANRNRPAPLIEVTIIKNDHDRFLIIDETVYHLGPSVKDAGVKRCAVIKMISTPDKILKDLILRLS